MFARWLLADIFSFFTVWTNWLNWFRSTCTRKALQFSQCVAKMTWTVGGRLQKGGDYFVSHLVTHTKGTFIIRQVFTGFQRQVLVPRVRSPCFNIGIMGRLIVAFSAILGWWLWYKEGISVDSCTPECQNRIGPRVWRRARLISRVGTLAFGISNEGRM